MADVCRPGHEPYKMLDRLKLRCYLPHEIERISVLRITETKTFDEVGHPISGGLYDSRLGPLETYDTCETCHQQGTYCPGHMGHIQLEVPVFNPLLFGFTFSLMNGTCVQCHRLTCNSSSLQAKLLLAQLRALDLGFISIAQELGGFIKDRFSAESGPGALHGDAPSLSDEFNACKELDTFLDKFSEQTDSTIDKNQSFPVKNALELKRSLIRNFCREQLFKRRRRCRLCSRSNGIIRNDGGRCILIDFGGTNSMKKHKQAARFAPLKNIGNIEDQEVDAGKLTNHSYKFSDEDMKAEGDEKNFNDKGTAYGSLVNSSEQILGEQLQWVLKGNCDKLAWRGAEVREHFRILWQNDGSLLRKMFPVFDSEDDRHCPLDILFCEAVLVPPTKYRPVRIFKGDKFESPQTINLRKLLEASETIRAIRLALSGNNEKALLNLVSESVIGQTMQAKMHNAYLTLQQRMGAIFDQDLDKWTDARIQVPGIKQILEKKQGLFRMNMMGKRVNYACRSVITPDPYLDVDEIGIPELFAKKLTVTETANAMNLARLRKMIKNGPGCHPGANFIQKPGRYTQVLSINKANERDAAAKRLQPGSSCQLGYPLQVLRHLDKGDLMLMNRQPSLHKPSMMGHRTRVLKSQRALRMNYAPCKAYNADFDGDEMNGHFVQNRIAQTELAEIANVGSNFLVPKDGTPLLGLIQDHVVSGVLLTIRGRFFNKEDFMHLVLSAFAETTQRLVIPPPAMLKPQVLWSGKQIISTVLRNCIPLHKPLLNIRSKAKTPLSCWKVEDHPAPKFDMSESEVIFRQAELLVGVLDKQHYGSTQYGLIHCCWDLYGHRYATRILSCFSRLFTTHLQYHGFTLGVADILVRKEADKLRKKEIKTLRKCGNAAVRECFNLDENADESEIKHVMASAYCNPKGEQNHIQQLDYKMKETLNQFNERINRHNFVIFLFLPSFSVLKIFACVPAGLLRLFPQNALQLMILSGAKGTMVNSIQISCELGQIELEGHRPPMTSAGRTLPSFRSFDTSPRAGGFVDQRFLTGINPQELFFHTMAGREGLIDTAVKTSRSGYLQRCIVKHLEGLVAHYDSTVRDHDGSVIQFRYGEDGMDVCKSTFMNSKQFDFLADNMQVLRSSVLPVDYNEDDWDLKKCEKAYKKIKKWRRKYGIRSRKIYTSGYVEFSKEHRGTPKEKIQKMWFELSNEERYEYHCKAGKACPAAVDEVLVHLLLEIIVYFCEGASPIINPHIYLARILCKICGVLQKMNPNRSLGALPQKLLDDIDEYIRMKSSVDTDIPLDTFRKSLYWKGMRCRVDPGENVGLLAAQSIGEPSTQMTLNTFHFAGRGEMNVTLGIPRLREILMTASNDIKTPSAEIHIKPGTSPERIEAIKRELGRIYLKELIKKFAIDERVSLHEKESWRCYDLHIELLRTKERIECIRHISRRRILTEVERRFVKAIGKRISDRCREMTDYQALQHKKLKLNNLTVGVGSEEETPKPKKQDDGISSDEEVGGGIDLDADGSRILKRHLDDAAEYEGEEDEQRAVLPQTKIEDTFFFSTESEDEEAETTAEGDKDVNDSSGTRLRSQEAETSRIQSVIASSPLVRDYKFDVKSNRWCTITFQVPLSTKTKLDVGALVERELESFLVWETPGIEKCIVRCENRGDGQYQILATQGINVQALMKHSDVLDVNTLYSNDLNMIYNNYGIEACVRALVKEIIRVFTPYGIDVNWRHLTLAADYMTFTGRIQPFSRSAMSSSASPLQRMTFETTIAFMRDALINGDDDYLMSPSSRLVIGGLLRGGTGIFDLMLPKLNILTACSSS
uniref:DNA-directed RNA polymerase subunit n=1 Tax=Elaeophora elaphi TaxID=1147741 RepID=A0A158Q757_9BILA